MKTLVRKVVPALRNLLANPLQDDLLPSACYSLRLPLEPDWEVGWKMYPHFKGKTRNGVELSCHASVLIPGHCPHQPHAHIEEEILLMLAGEAELILPQQLAGNGRHRACPGDFVYYPSFHPHTLRATGPEPASYLMFKWSTKRQPTAKELGFMPMHIQWPDAEQPGRNGYRSCGLFEGATRHLDKLHCHSSSLEPGGGYAAHIDAHDVAILVLRGECEILDKRIGPGAVAFCAAGEPHGMHNPGLEEARYLVFEFHGAYRPRAGARLLRRVSHNH